LFTEHVAITIFIVLTHSCFLAVYLKDKNPHLAVTEVDMSDAVSLFNHSTAFTPVQL